MQDFETMSDAADVARKILAGTMEPHLGCGLIAAIAEKINYPDALDKFTHLAHLQSGHEEVGFTAESCFPDILAACRTLVARQP